MGRKVGRDQFVRFYLCGDRLNSVPYGFLGTNSGA